MCSVQTRDETAVLQGAQLGRRTLFRTDDIIEGEAQGCMVLMSPLMLIPAVGPVRRVDEQGDDLGLGQQGSSSPWGLL